jgi:hypothetical protein
MRVFRGFESIRRFSSFRSGECGRAARRRFSPNFSAACRSASTHAGFDRATERGLAKVFTGGFRSASTHAGFGSTSIAIFCRSLRSCATSSTGLVSRYSASTGVAISLFQTSSFRPAWPGRDTLSHPIPA